MPRAAKVTADWCSPTAELEKPQLLQLLHTKRAPTAELMSIPEEELELVVEATPLPRLKRQSNGPLRDAWFQDTDDALEIVAEAGHQPAIRHLSEEEEAALAEAESDSIIALAAPTGTTGALPVVLDEPPPRSVPRAVPTAVAVYPVQTASSSLVATLLAIMVILGAAAGGVLFAMNVVGPF